VDTAILLYVELLFFIVIFIIVIVFGVSVRYNDVLYLESLGHAIFFFVSVASLAAKNGKLPD